MDRVYFTADRPLAPAALQPWAARLTGCSPGAVICRDVDENEPDGPAAVLVLHRRLETEFSYEYEVIPLLGPCSVPDVRQQVTALAELAVRTDSWIVADPDDHEVDRVLLITGAHVWYSYFDAEYDLEGSPSDLETARAVAWTTRINRPLGQLFIPDGIPLEPIESAVAEALGVARRALVWRPLEGEHPRGPEYDRELIETHLRRAHEVSFADLQPWRHVEEELAAWVDAVQAAARAVGAPLYTTHGTFSVVANIPGGSDNQAHCLRLDGRTVEEIVYKRRRTSW